VRLLVLAAALLLCLPLSTPGIGLRAEEPPRGSEKDRDLLFADLDRQVAALQSQGQLLKTVVRLVTPTVVHIEAMRKDVPPGMLTGQARSVEEAGSGVIIRIDDRSYVLTNRHVIRQAPLDQVKVRLADGRSPRPERVWSDRSTDLAVLALDGSDFVTARLGDSDQVEIGDFVLALGSPFGLSHSVTYGIISAKGRRNLELGGDGVRYQDFLQTDAAINPGNSGGPLMNLRGEVIGINTAIASNSGGNEGIGFAIPVNMALFVARQLVRHGKVSHAYLGVRLDNSFGPEMAHQMGLPAERGALVKGVTPGSPAETAGFLPNDLIVRFNEVPVDDDSHLVNLVSMTPVEKLVSVHFWRRNQLLSVDVRLADRGQFEQSN